MLANFNRFPLQQPVPSRTGCKPQQVYTEVVVGCFQRCTRELLHTSSRAESWRFLPPCPSRNRHSKGGCRNLFLSGVFSSVSNPLVKFFGNVSTHLKVCLFLPTSWNALPCPTNARCDMGSVKDSWPNRDHMGCAKGSKIGAKYLCLHSQH